MQPRPLRCRSALMTQTNQEEESPPWTEAAYTQLAKDADKAIWWVCVLIGAMIGLSTIGVASLIFVALWRLSRARAREVRTVRADQLDQADDPVDRQSL
jgi:hypothetical protein